MSNLHGFINRLWYNPSRLQRCLSILMQPFAWLLQQWARRVRARQLRQLQSLPLPVIVVGNISVGGTGKTPLIIALAQSLRARGYRPGVVSRGYGSHSNTYPLLLNPQTPIAESGDEPALIYQTLNTVKGQINVGEKGKGSHGSLEILVCIDPNRRGAALHLYAQGCDIILSDDGLQHYRLARDIELVVVDAVRRFGNHRTLPAGPLREPVNRLQTVDAVITNGHCETVFHDRQYEMQLKPLHWVSLIKNDDTAAAMDDAKDVDGNALRASAVIIPLAELSLPADVQAISGIGNPQRFFDTLAALNITAQTQAFADHYDFGIDDLRPFSGRVLIMTAKDAIKCRRYVQELDASRWYYLEVEAILSEDFFDQMAARINLLVAHSSDLIEN